MAQCPEEAFQMVQSTTIDRFVSPAIKAARPSLMLIESNASLRDSLADFLEEEGYEVDKCVDLPEALVLLESGYLPDLMVVDDAGAHGPGWLARLRGARDARTARVPLVEVSAGGLSLTGSRADAGSTSEAGSEVNASLSKPVQPALLLATVSQLLAAAEEDRISTQALELQRLNTLGGISSGLANELNNPLSFLVGNLELARKKCHDLGRRLDGQELTLLHEIERLIHHATRGARRVGEVVQGASAMPLATAFGPRAEPPASTRTPEGALRRESGRVGAIDVDFESDQNGPGSGFGAASFGRATTELRSPALARPPEGGLRSREQPEPTDMTQRARILVIDDEQLMCELLGTMLADDYEVETLANAREALSKLQGGASYDLILCDLMMPELTGMDLHAELSRLRPEQAARMVFMTGGTFTDRAQHFLAEHGRVQLQKPFRHDELLSLVRTRLTELRRSVQSNLH